MRWRRSRRRRTRTSELGDAGRPLFPHGETQSEKSRLETKAGRTGAEPSAAAGCCSPERCSPRRASRESRGRAGTTPAPAARLRRRRGPGGASSICRARSRPRTLSEQRLLVCIPRTLRAFREKRNVQTSSRLSRRRLHGLLCCDRTGTIETRSWKMAGLCGRRGGTIRKKSRKRSGGLTLRNHVLPLREAGGVGSAVKGKWGSPCRRLR
jgi:hypothetical protein